MEKEIYFEVVTPLEIKVRTTKQYWQYVSNVKHPAMKGKEEIVKDVLSNPEEIYRSKIDQSIYLYYKRFDRTYCVVVKHINNEGYLITAYPTYKIKEGVKIWKR